MTLPESLQLRRWSVCAALFLAPLASAESPDQQLYLVRFEAPSVVEAIDGAVLAKRISAERQLQFEAKAQQVRSAQDGDLEELEELLGRSLETRFRYAYGLNGAALWLSPAEAERLQDAPGVAALVPDRSARLQTDAGPRFIGADQVWSGVDGAGRRGEGVVVGIVDTGISASHPAFADIAPDGYDHSNPRGRRFGLCTGAAAGRCNDKLIGIYDFTSEGGRDGSDVEGHGTHVASIAVANPFSGQLNAPTLNVPLTLSGVAPRANLITYKACISDNAGGDCPNSSTIAALDQAIADGVDVINYSIGGSPVNPWAELNSASFFRSMFNARAAGIVVTVSAGNEGPVAGSVSSPANAPWVLGVANATHDRVFQTSLAELSGSTSPPQAAFEGMSLSAAMVATAPIVLGEQNGSALCGTGTGLDFPPTGASNPFASGSLTGMIVVCDRGVQSRVAKGNNVALGGALGMILVNAEGDGDSLIADGHFLPTVHIGYQSGQLLKHWLRSTSDARGRISATTAARVPRLGDVLNISSSQGPDETGAGVAKPNLSAPGTSILAADHLSPGVRSLSGTSMAAPHVAGAAALLKSAHPDWSAERIVSALVLTAAPSGLRNVDGTAASFAAAGAGRTQVQRATRASLFLPLSRAQFSQANPATGGDPSALNLPELFQPLCRTRCTLQRTVEANSAGSWTVDSDLPTGMKLTATPTQFSLAAGGRQTLRFEFDVSAGAVLGRTLNGQVHLRAADPQAELLTLPVQIHSDAGTVPSQISARLSAERGTTQLNLGNGLVALPGANYRLLGPATSQSSSNTLLADTDDPTDAFDADAGVSTILVTVPSGSTALLALLRSSNGVSDVDLYVGRDGNLDGVASRFETLCGQRSGAAQKACVLTDINAGQYWIRSHNPSNTSRPVQLEYASLRAGESTISGPARVAAGSSLNVQLAYDVGGNLTQLRQLAVLQAYAEFDAPQPFAEIPLLLDRDPAMVAVNRPQLLFSAANEQFVLPGGGSLDGLFFDDPGDGVVRRLIFTGSNLFQLSVLAGPSLPQLANGLSAAADTPVLVSRSGGLGSEFDLPASSTPRRLYLRVNNSSTLTASFSVQRENQPAAVLSNGARPGMYFNPARGGHGLFLTRARNELQLAWYTYDTQGRPVFYLASAADAFVSGQPGLRAQVRMELNQYVWNGRSARGQVVGMGELTSLGSDRFQWSWQLDQAAGSEPMELLATSACVDNADRSVDYSGLWFNPDLPGYGASIFTRPDLELQAVYLYDQQGLPRWLWSEAAPFGSASSTLYQYSGFCTGCSFAPVSRVSVGTLTRSYSPTPGSVGQWRVQAGFSGVLNGSSWDTSGPLLALTESSVCN